MAKPLQNPAIHAMRGLLRWQNEPKFETKMKPSLAETVAELARRKVPAAQADGVAAQLSPPAKPYRHLSHRVIGCLGIHLHHRSICLGRDLQAVYFQMLAILIVLNRT
jgi:hypothetical protein